jgi:hypothetical protein
MSPRICRRVEAALEISYSSIDIAPEPQLDDEHDKPFVLDFPNDTVAALADPIPIDVRAQSTLSLLSTARLYNKVACSVISVLNSFDTGQPALASSAIFWN